MTTLHLLIADAALRDAVAEQIAAAGLPAPRVAGSAASSPLSGEGGVILIDDAAWGKEAAIWSRDTTAGADRPVLLLLGEAGDTDLITETFAKPIRLGHLITRIRYYLETAPLLRDRAATFGPYRLEPHSRRILGGKIGEARLTEKETALLAFLAHSPQPATRREILAAVWGYDERIDTHTLETHIYQLRRKLDAGGENWLINEAGAYRLARGQE